VARDALFGRSFVRSCLEAGARRWTSILPRLRGCLDRLTLRAIAFGALALASCSHSPDSDLGRQASIRKEATAILTRDTQRIAKRRGLTWLSTEPIVSWSKTPVSLRLASHRALQAHEAELLAKDILHAMLWSCNSHRAVRAFINREFNRPEQRAIEWEDLALKISFWNKDGERYQAPMVSQLVVQKGMITIWAADTRSHKLADPQTHSLPPPSLEAGRGKARQS
jgi:hypothetical protein